MAFAIGFPVFNNVGRSVTPIFLLIDRFLYRFVTFSEKIKKFEFFAKSTIEFRSF